MHLIFLFTRITSASIHLYALDLVSKFTYLSDKIKYTEYATFVQLYLRNSSALDAA